MEGYTNIERNILDTIKKKILMTQPKKAFVGNNRNLRVTGAFVTSNQNIKKVSEDIRKNVLRAKNTTTNNTNSNMNKKSNITPVKMSMGIIYKRAIVPSKNISDNIPPRQKVGRPTETSLSVVNNSMQLVTCNYYDNNKALESYFHKPLNDELKVIFPYQDIHFRELVGFEEYDFKEYWMGSLDYAIDSLFSKKTIKNLLDDPFFSHNVSSCILLFVYNDTIKSMIENKYRFMDTRVILVRRQPLLNINGEIEIPFIWNEKIELFTIGYEINIDHFIQSVPKCFRKYWILFEDDIPSDLIMYLEVHYGNTWVENLKNEHNVCIIFLNTQNTKQSYEVLLKFYKTLIYYYSNSPVVHNDKSKWFYECFYNGTPIFTTNENEFDLLDYLDVKYNLIIRDIMDEDMIREMFNTKNIQMMSTLITKWRQYIDISKYNILEYFRNVHRNRFIKRIECKKDVNLLI